VIERYLNDLGRALPWGVSRRRILAEVEDHLRASAREVGEVEAVERFGPPGDVARGYQPLGAARLAALAVAVVALSFAAHPALYPLAENTLPPAPWPSEAMKPAHLAWKQDVTMALLLLGAGSVAVALLTLPRGNWATVAAAAAAVVAMAGAAIVGTVLAFEWAEAVPGTPGWLAPLGFVQVGLALTAGGFIVRAVTLRRVAAQRARGTMAWWP
jgi:HAAS